jgi:acetylornithine deacetylase
MINGGTEPSIYAASCKLQIERRTIAGETEAAITQELQAIIDRLAAADSTFNATLEAVYQREPFDVAADAPIVTALEDAVTRRLGKKPEHIGQPFWTDAAFLSAAGMETVLIGPTGQGLHAAEEWVDVQSVVDLAHILAETAMTYCSG